MTGFKKQIENARKAIKALEAGESGFWATEGNFTWYETFHENRESDMAFFRELLTNLERLEQFCNSRA